MIEGILIGVLIGWFGHGQIVTVNPNPLVETECVDIQPPQDKTFGATTEALISGVGTYQKCSAASKAK